MTTVSHYSRKFCRWALASSLGRPQNFLAYTIEVRPVRISKLPFPILTAGPVGTLATTGVE